MVKVRISVHPAYDQTKMGFKTIVCMCVGGEVWKLNTPILQANPTVNNNIVEPLIYPSGLGPGGARNYESRSYSINAMSYMYYKIIWHCTYIL